MTAWLPLPGRVAKAALLAAGLIGFGATANGESLQITGYIGVLGEWELTGNLTATGSDRAKEFVGPVKMLHVGYCTQDGPEERTGEIRVRLSGTSPSRMTAALIVNGVECSYSGRQTDTYTGMLKCPDRRAVPLTIWLKPEG
ncbi:hypothetical protein [Reyranella sp.]|uniref:hypothetical protein n=1 Tax=Reyranella sp. TaxID=1929291 RepID=UPI00120BE38A|nr:hypothetical protein [Reyranella sp.]TAJ90875.1 MAG: hypothetical protein EPO50_00945 [Reyranella sp.]